MVLRQLNVMVHGKVVYSVYGGFLDAIHFQGEDMILFLLLCIGIRVLRRQIRIAILRRIEKKKTGRLFISYNSSGGVKWI